MAYGLNDKVAIVTGAGQGIGRAIAERYAQEGVKVLVADVNAATAELAVEEITRQGGQALTQVCDVREETDVKAMFDLAEEHLGPVDILVSNAGLSGATTILDETVEHWDNMFAVNVRGVFLGLQEATRRMLPRKAGCIINMASGVGKIGRPHMTSYCATKHAVIGLTRAAALELGPHGIRVNALCPGIVDTQIWRDMDPVLTRLEGRTDSTAWERRVTGIPLGRHSVPADIANAAVLLACDDASYITGQSLSVDGGLVMI